MSYSNNQPSNARLRIGVVLTFICLVAAFALLRPTRLVTAQGGVSWSFTGNLNIARESHTATLLPNGKVLVAGGSVNNGDPQNSAELYDPATGTWSVTGNLNTARARHIATLLPDGRVLVVGGYGNCVSNRCSPLNSTELYNPATGAWVTGATLNRIVQVQTATLLLNGKVLVTGPDDVSPFQTNNTAELYDPATGIWSITGSPNLWRTACTATLLTNGKVLIAGGITYLNNSFGDPDSPTNKAELYDPATGTWTNTGNLNTARYNHTATLLANGKVLVASFLDLYFEGIVKRAELYDPATGIWSNTANVIEGRSGQTATLLPSGKVLVAGGYDSHFSLKSVELYDPATGSWSTTADLNTARVAHTATLLQNGKVLVVGGEGANYESSKTAELYDPGTNQAPNLIDDTQFFVRQHYRDFLNRDADPDGLNFWTGQIFMCGLDPQCIEVKRINDSASFFLSIEFQESGYLVYRFHKAAFGNLPGAPVPIKFADFLTDDQQLGQGVIVNQAGWQTVLENNKQTYASAFVQRSQFTSSFPTSISPATFVDTLFANAGVTPTSADRAAAIDEFGAASTTVDVAARARAMRRVAENSTLAQQEFNRAFVLMQYFGYLRRNPNDAPEATLDFQGYNFWLNKLNQFQGNFVQAEMVKAFISSTEYRRRFGP